MRYRVLGRTVVSGTHSPVEDLPPKPRVVLALLIINIGRVVLVDELADEVWGDRPPATAVTTLQTYVYRLRRMFGRRGGPELLTRPLGYELVGEPSDVDMYRFVEHVTLARRDAAPEAVAASAQSALDLYQGELFADVRPGPRIRAQRERLAEMRMCANELLILSGITTGRHREAVEQLRPLVRENPLNELLNGYLMFSLAAAGRRQDALGVYSVLRDGMIEELGLDPCEPLVRLHRQVLSDGDLTLPFADTR